jgi:hypothetical protein
MSFVVRDTLFDGYQIRHANFMGIISPHIFRKDLGHHQVLLSRCQSEGSSRYMDPSGTSAINFVV